MLTRVSTLAYMLVQELKPLDHRKRRVLVNWAVNEIAFGPSIQKGRSCSVMLIFSCGYVNSRNFMTWSKEKP